MERPEVVRCFQDVGLSSLEARDLEIGIYNATIDYAADRNVTASWKTDLFCEIYLAKCRSLHANLSGACGAKLRKRLADGEFKPHELASFLPERLDPDQWHEIAQKELMKDKGAYEPMLVPNSTKWFCGKCKKNKCSVVYVQTRSADEPATAFVTCLNCGYKFKS